MINSVVFQAVDRASSVVRQMANKVNNAVESMEKKYESLKNVSRSVATSAFIGAAAIATPFTLAAKEAIKFEDKVADVAKVMNLDAGSEGLRRVNNEIKTLAGYLGTAPEATAELYANIAQSGVAANDVGRVSKLAGEMGIAFGIGADQAGASFVKLQNAMGITIDQTKVITDALNHLGNNTASQSSELLEFMASGGAGAARNLGILGEQAAAFGSVLIANGKSAAESGTIFERMMKGIFKDSAKLSMYNKAGGGLAGVLAIIEQGSKLTGQAQFNYFKSFGDYGTDISMLSKNFAQLQSTLGLVADKTKFADSSFAEFENRQKTTQVQLEKLKTNLVIAGITIGEAILPVLTEIAQKVIPIIQRFSQWASENPKLMKTIVIISASLTALLLVIGTFATVINMLITVKTAWIGVQTALNVVLSANPIGIIILAIGALIAIIVFLVVKVKGWGEQWDEVWSFAKAVFMQQVSIIKLGLLGFLNAILSMIDVVVKGWMWFQNKIGNLNDQAYNNALSNIEKEKQARLGAMREVYGEMNKHTQRVQQGVGWKLGWDDGSDATNTATNSAMSYNPNDIKKANFIESWNVAKSNLLKIQVEGKNSNVDVVSNDGGIPIDVSPAFG